MRSRTIIFILLLTGTLIGAMAAFVLMAYLGPPIPINNDGSLNPPAVLAEQSRIRAEESSTSLGLTRAELRNIDIYRLLNPSVVNITTIEITYDFFFSPIRDQGTGSGSVLDSQGHILTNYHVVQNADYIQVTLADQSRYKGEIVGFDEINDIAVLKIDTGGTLLQAINLGNSSELQVGQVVYAIGNPFGLSHTLTTGIISSLGRSIKSKSGYIIDDVIQADAAINPGNSGGPLIDSSGNMIGITTSIFTTSGGNIGLGFSVPVDTVKRVTGDLIRYGEVRRPWVGIYGQSIGKDLARYLELPQQSGVLVAYVEEGSSADRAGILGGQRKIRIGNYRVVIGGDFITNVDQRPISSMDDLTSYLLNRSPGDTVRLTVYRNGEESDISMQMIEKPGSQRL